MYRLAFGLQPKKVLLPAPAFVEYEEALSAAGAQIEYYRMTEDFIIKEDILEKITEDTAYQTIHYIAWDKAGNKLDSNDNGDTRKCLVTTNKPVKEYYKNNPKSQIIMGIVIAATVFTSGCIAFYNRKKHK